MIHNLNLVNNLQLLFPINHEFELEQFVQQKPINAFSDEVLDVLSELGAFLREHGRELPNIIAVGFWLRKQHLLMLKSQYPSLHGRGISLHFAPGNVDTLFFYSAIISVVTGNLTMVRVSHQNHQAAAPLLAMLNEFVNCHQLGKKLAERLVIFTYEKSSEISALLSKFADVRVIWGGNEAVTAITKLPVKNGAIDCSFPDRYSISILTLSDVSEINAAATAFAADVTPFFQQACASPKVVYWVNTAQELQKVFWQQVSALITKAKLTLSAGDSLRRYLFLQQASLLTDNNCAIGFNDNTLTVIEGDDFNGELLTAHPGLFIFLSHNVLSLEPINLLSHCQTIGVFDLSCNVQNEIEKQTKWPHRQIVKLGRALEFTPVWDGIDLIKQHCTEQV